MNRLTSVQEKPYLINLEHEDIVAGKQSFREKSLEKALVGLFWLFVFAALSWVWIPNVRGSADWLIWGMGMLFFLAMAGKAFYSALVYRRLVHGQYLTGEIVSCRVTVHSKNVDRRFKLNVTYRFYSPNGQSLEQNESAIRPDFYVDVPRQASGFRVLFNSDVTPYFAPDAGTPVTIRYVDDNFYRVM